MTREITLVIPEPISDEAAFALSELLHALAVACDDAYYGQIRRYLGTLDKAEPLDPARPWIKKPRSE
jgi:hypothetical protein